MELHGGFSPVFRGKSPFRTNCCRLIWPKVIQSILVKKPVSSRTVRSSIHACRQLSVKDKQMCLLPAVFRKEDNVLAAFSEADLFDYPGLYLISNGNGSASFEGILPQVPVDE